MPRGEHASDNKPWPQKMVDRLVQLVEKGLGSYGTIAKELNDEFPKALKRPLTASAVIGKAHRLGLTSKFRPKNKGKVRVRRVQTSPQTNQQKNFVERVNKVRAAKTPDEIRELHPVSEAMRTDAFDALKWGKPTIPLHRLDNAKCHWPFDTSTGVRYCGDATLTGLPYCSHHARISYNGVPPKKRYPVRPKYR